MSAMVAILSLNLLLEDWMKSIQWAEKIYEDFYLIAVDNIIYSCTEMAGEGEGTLVELSGDISDSCLSWFIFSDIDGFPLSVEFASESTDDGGDDVSCPEGTEVCLGLDGGNLNYSSTVDIARFQFSHDGCVESVSGGECIETIIEETRMDILFNISLAYNNAASSFYNTAGNVFNSDNPKRSELKESMNNYNIAYEYFDIARDYFMELEDMGSDNGASMALQVKGYMDLIEETQVPFVQKQLDSLNSN
jgi:hypothetical protein